MRPRSVTAERSSESSAAVASIFVRLKSLISSPCTISQFPSEVVTGKEYIRPSGMPYEPSEVTAIETQSSSGVPWSQSRAASMVADAADAADRSEERRVGEECGGGV